MGQINRNMENVTGINHRISIFDTAYPIDKSDWFQVFSACLGKVVTLQEACGEIVVRGQDWNVDFEEGNIYFGDQAYPLQFIGSEAVSDNSWMWGWHNINGFDDKIISLSSEAKRIGEQWGLEPFTIQSFSLDDTFNGHTMAIAVCGTAKEEYCYYRGPHAGGAIFVAFCGVPDGVFSSVDQQKFISTAMKCIQQFAVDHKIFTESYLMWNGVTYEWDQLTIVAHFKEDLYIEFEQTEGGLRIRSMKTKLTK